VLTEACRRRRHMVGGGSARCGGAPLGCWRRHLHARVGEKVKHDKGQGNRKKMNRGEPAFPSTGSWSGGGFSLVTGKNGNEGGTGYYKRGVRSGWSSREGSSPLAQAAMGHACDRWVFIFFIDSIKRRRSLHQIFQIKYGRVDDLIRNKFSHWSCFKIQTGI
jgi:hypothetical protein